MGKLRDRPVVRFMPVVQYESNLSETTEVARFLVACRQRAEQTDEVSIASLTFSIAPIAPWQALAVLGEVGDRHFYYDSPNSAAFVGVRSVIECHAVGQSRFKEAQAFTQRWQSRFVYKSFAKTAFAEPPFAEPPFIDKSARTSAEPKSHFFCSAAFFEQTTTNFEPICVFVPQVQVTTTTDISTVNFNCLMTAQTDIDQTALRIFRQLEQLKRAGRISLSPRLAKRQIVRNVDGFAQSVAAVLEHLQDGLHKVVLADVMDVVAEAPFDGVRSLQALRQNHPDCTVFSVGNGCGQSFIGASPERLLSIQKHQITTDALAGSAPRGATPEIDIQLAQTLLSSKKERYEHRVVVEFLLKQLRSLGLNPQCAAAPQLMRLFHIQHLYTPISAALNPHRPISPLEVLSRLHPTPAVAGVPRQQACDLIRQQETFDRGLYAAPLGWIDTAGNSEFMVGIRSALIDGCNARLYAGAGIVSGSQPDRELAEIRLKLQSLLNALV